MARPATRVSVDCRAQGTDHRCGFGDRSGYGHRLCPRGCRSGAELPARGRGRRPGSGQAGGSRGSQGRLRSGDLKDEAFCTQLVSKAKEALGGSGHLVNVAGKQTAVQDIAELTTEQFDATYKTNVYALFLAVQGRPAAPAGRRRHHQHHPRSRPPSLRIPAGLRLDQGGHHQLHQGPRQAGRQQGHPRQRRGSRSLLDPAAAQRRQPQEKIPTFGGETVFKRPGQPRNWHPSMCCWLPRNRAM